MHTFWFVSTIFVLSIAVSPTDAIPNPFSKPPRGPSRCQPGQVFCFETMSCEWPLRESNKGKYERLQVVQPREPVVMEKCQPNEFFCFESGKCRKRVSSSGIIVEDSPLSNGKRRKRRVKLLGTAIFQVDFDTILGTSKKMETFKSNFEDRLGKALNVPKGHVVVIELRKGSIETDFSALQTEQVNDLSNDELVDQWKSQVSEGLETIEVDNGEDPSASVSSYTFTEATVEDLGPADEKEEEDELPWWLWLIIGLLILLIILITILLVYYCCCRKREKVVHQPVNTNVKHQHVTNEGYTPPPPYPTGDGGNQKAADGVAWSPMTTDRQASEVSLANGNNIFSSANGNTKPLTAIV